MASAQHGISGRAQARLHHRFGAEPLYGPDARDGLLDDTCKGAPFSLQVGYGFPHPLGEPVGGEGNQRQGGHCDHSQQRARQQQDHRYGGSERCVAHPKRSRRNDRLDLEQVACHPRQKLAPVDVGVVGDVQVEKVVVEIPA